MFSILSRYIITVMSLCFSEVTYGPFIFCGFYSALYNKKLKQFYLEKKLSAVKIN